MNMNNYTIASPRRRWPKILAIIFCALAILTVLAVVAVRQEYHENLKAASATQKSVLITIPSGASVKEIATLLKREGVIRSDWAFEWYVNSKDIREDLQAGTYAFKPSQTVPEIVAILTQGKIATDLITILPGQRIDQIRSAFIESGMAASAVDEALKPAKYSTHPALVDKPPQANLEGYLYPESFQKTATTKPEEIVRKSLDEMQKYLTPEIRKAIVKQGLSVHEGVILASIIEQEVSKAEDKPKVAQVFLKRLRENIPLGSDPTAPYGAIIAGQPPSLTYESPYNTHTHAGLPPAPISNVSASSLKAVASPASTDWLYFVSGDDGVTYFSKTLAEHEALTEQHCKKLCN